MRLFLLPISTRRTLIYAEPIASTLPAAQQKYLDRLVNKANTTWTSWETSSTTWKLKTTAYGNALFRRIAFEEWGLKSIPPLRKDSDTTGAGGARTLQLRYPPAYTPAAVLPIVSQLATSRQALHRRRMWGAIALMPVTIPFGLIPVVPNLPFFYLLFRTYSHWRALQGAYHLAHLLERRLLSPSPSATLDALYTAGLVYPDAAQARAAGKVPGVEQTREVAALVGAQGDAEEVLLLKGWNGKVLAERLKLPGLQIEIERAVEQVEAALKVGRDEVEQGERAQVEEKRKA